MGSPLIASYSNVGVSLHIRITAVPPRRAIDGLDLSGLQVGGTYLLATRLATYLVDGGFAESTKPVMDSVTALWRADERRD
jgi:hypothetical protein